jgi:hypothetical protein
MQKMQLQQLQQPGALITPFMLSGYTTPKKRVEIQEPDS